MAALNLDATERKQFITHLRNQLGDGNVGANFDECYDSLLSKFGERYEMEDGQLDSELEGLIFEAMQERINELYDMADPSAADIDQTCDLEYALGRAAKAS